MLSPLFLIDPSTGSLTLLRRFEAAEVPNKQFVIQVTVTDSVGQLVSSIATVTVFDGPKLVTEKLENLGNWAFVRLNIVIRLP